MIEIEDTKIYQLFVEQRNHILRNKWFLSEKAGHDVGFERALIDWTINHRCEYMKHIVSQSMIECN